MKSLWVALSTLTLLPVPTSFPTPKDLKQSVIWYPLVGAMIGAGLVGTQFIPIPHDLKALIALFFWVGITGAFHLDGLGDCLDGFFGGSNTKERQRIMKKADLGTYGVVGMVLTLITKYVLLNHLIGRNYASIWLLAVPVAARWAVCLACFTSLSPKGNKGLGSFVMGISLPVFLACSILAIIGCSFLQLNALGVFVIASLVASGVSRLSQACIGGLTGDGLGAIIELSEIALLFFACFFTFVDEVGL